MKKIVFAAFAVVVTIFVLSSNLIAGDVGDAANAADKLEYRIKYYDRDGKTVVKTDYSKACRYAYSDVMDALATKKYGKICIDPMYDFSAFNSPDCNKCYYPN